MTTTPRQRIVLRREMARQPRGSLLQRVLTEQYEYDGIETCAADGSCVLSCPVGIDTGELIKDFRAREHGARARGAALKVAQHWALVERAARGALRVGGGISRVRGDRALRAATRALRRVVSTELVPEWGREMPLSAPTRPPATERHGAAAVYVPSCVNRIFGASRAATRNGSGVTVMDAMVAVSARAGLPLWIPPDVAGHCCGLPSASKGYPEAYAWMANKIVDGLWRWTSGGKLPVVIDATSCALGLRELGAGLSEENRKRHGQLEVTDALVWASKHLAPRLTLRARARSVAVHPTCAGRHLGVDRALRSLAGQLAEGVYVPPSAGCCGFAGDRGFLHPELTEAATREEARELEVGAFDAYLSSNRTCEIAMERATGQAYVHVVGLLEELTRPG